MKNDKNLEQLLQQALSPEEEPDYWLNQKILRKAKEREMMNKQYRKKMPAIAISAAVVLSISSLTAVAAWKYLTPDQVAEEVKDQGLAAAFQSQDAVSIQESQEYGNYKITLLGVVSGKNLSQYVNSDDAAGDIRDDRTYVVTAIENADGSPRPGTRDDDYGKDPFFVSPLIKGQNPSLYNALTMSGGYSEFVQDGIQYRITETDNIEVFADRGLYLAVNSGTFYDSDAYLFEEATGEIARNEAFEGVNALFQLPLDEKKADREKADAYIRRLEKELAGAEDEPADGDGVGDGFADGNSLEDKSGDENGTEQNLGKYGLLAKEIEGWTQKDLEQKAELLDDLTQTLTVDEEGYFSYSYQMEADGTRSSSGTILAESIFKEDQVGMSESKYIVGGGGKKVYIETFTREEDGTITLKVYQYQKD